MRSLLLAIATAIASMLSPQTKPRQLLLLVIIILAIAIASYLMFGTGCMTTLDLDGKVYKTRVDVLTPIMPTTTDQVPTRPAPTTRPTR